MGNAQRDIHGNFAMKRYRMKMVIQSIDGGKLLKENSAKSNAKVHGSIIDGSFHTVHIFPNVTMLISMSKSARALAHSNTFSNMYLRVVIGQLQYYKMKSMKFKIMSTHVIYLHLKQSGVFLVSSCIIDLQQFNGYKFIFQTNKLLHLTMIQTLLNSYKMSVLARPP